MRFVNLVTIVALCSAMFITACQPSKEDYKSTRHDYKISVNVHMASPELTAKACADLGLTEVNGCNSFNLDTKVCDIYVSPQRFVQDEERLVIMGHELDHCVHGKWHE